MNETMTNIHEQQLWVEVGLHQGSTLSRTTPRLDLKPIYSVYMFLLLMDVLTEDVRKDVPGSVMFADDIVLCGDDEKYTIE